MRQRIFKWKKYAKKQRIFVKQKNSISSEKADEKCKEVEEVAVG